MQYNSIEIVNDENFIIKHRIQAEDTIGYDDLSTYTDSELKIYNATTKELEYTANGLNSVADTITIDDVVYGVVKSTIPANTLTPKYDGVDRGYMPLNAYYGVLTVEFSDRDDVNVIIDRIVVV